MPLTSIDPTTNKPIRSYPEDSAAEITRKLDAAATAFLDWRAVSFARRAEHIRHLGRVLLERRQELAVLMAQEMGKPLAQGRAEVEKSACACQHFAAHAAGYLADEPIDAGDARALLCYQPLGVILAVMPWNFPFWQVIRCAVPALMAGNTVVLKHASNVTGCAMAIDFTAQAAALPPGIFQTLLVSSAQIASVLDHPALRGVSLTGSPEAGRALAREAGQRLLKTVLELGGSDPYVILDDADLEQAARCCAASRLINSGQSCIAAKRFIVLDSVRPRFEQLFTAAMLNQRMGDPLEAETTVGPLARADLRDQLHHQVTRSIAAGAQCLLGGRIPAGDGAFYPPTVLTGVTSGMPVFDEETFGPVAAIVGAHDETEAVRWANQTPFGLGAAVFSRDPQRGERIARQLEAGCCHINDFVRSDPRLPFGGIKHSGYGRELGLLGIREFVNVKSLVRGA
ncbi:MAG: NAD-dependent succinate-semialdehyde dehydrogenase [Verrucomicrobia bacterium]|nr:NAD-dependent succinate-semialdehyde dehydrogenase [Verrucomicrobiota bacterium]